ncbi:MAG: OmpA family protein [Caulobacter sp.]|nr:OmpA family protein [Caulobacter sp.]
MNKGGLATMGVVAAIGLAATGCTTTNPWPKSRSQIVKAPVTCQDFSVQIYFDRDSAVITDEARQVLKDAGAMTKGCKIKSVNVLGLADAKGAPDANLELSKKRAGAVARALGKAGVRNVEFDLGAAGDAGAVTGSGEARPLRRQADVRFDLDGPLP